MAFVGVTHQEWSVLSTAETFRFSTHKHTRTVRNCIYGFTCSSMYTSCLQVCVTPSTVGMIMCSLQLPANTRNSNCSVWSTRWPAKFTLLIARRALA
jgi:hypothetical protein